MLLNVIKFEIKYRLVRPATYIYFAILFLISYVVITLPDSSVSEAGEQLHKNAPYIISQLTSSFMLFSCIILAGIMGVPVFREYDYRINEIIFSLPVKKWEYLAGKFIGSYIVALLIHIGIIVGLLAGVMMPWVEKGDLGVFNLESYLNPFFIFLIPNTFIFGMFFFVIGSSFRSQIAIYTQGMIFLVLYFSINILLGDIDTNPIYSIFEPFGQVAANFETKYWTTFEKNSLLLPFTGYILINRLLWMGIACATAIIFYFSFNHSHIPAFRKSAFKTTDDDFQKRNAINWESLNSVSNYTFKDQIYQWVFFAFFHFKKIIKAIPFIIMLFCGVGFLLMARYGVSLINTPSLPVTYMLLDFLQASFIFFVVIIITVYSGELIWRDIDAKFAPVVDASPISDKLIVLSKFTALVMVELFVLLIIMLTGITIQIINGFYDFQLLVYVKVLLLNVFPYLFISTFLIFLLHTLIHNKFVAHTAVIVFFLYYFFSESIGISHFMLRYGASIERSYSDMNGFHNFVFPALIVDLYWVFLGVIFLCLSILMIKRGHDLSLNQRFKNLKQNWNKGFIRYFIYGSFLAFIFTGTYIFYNTNILNEHRSQKGDREYHAFYERKYSKYRNYPQPRATDVKLYADIYPDKLRFEIRGVIKLTNKNNQPIDTFHVQTKPWAQINNISFSIPVQLIDSSKEYGYYMYRALKPFNPNDTISFEFNLSYFEKGFNFWGHGTEIVCNGSFIHNDYLPYFGYSEESEIHDKRQRKKAGLPEKEFQSREITDTAGYSNVYISSNADRINYEAIVSTVPDQTAITCGTLINEWTKDGRRYFHYKMNEPIWNFFPFLSAKYEVLRDKFDGVDIAIYYHKGHEYNIDKMVHAIKKTIAYCNKNYSNFQHNSIRIVEFPRYSQYAQSFSGTIPFSEAVGFIIDANDKEDIDVPFFVASHEVAHQWWGHQVCAANVKGKTMLVESLAEYTALMVMLEEFGDKQAGKFLKYELNRYMMGRATENKKESPLYLVDNQMYLSYQKGCLAFYNLMDFVGEDTLNKALSKFILEYQNKPAPYPTSVDLLRYIKKTVPDSLQYLISDWFETITLYKNRTDSAFYKKLQNGKYLVSLYTTSQKFRADSLGKEDPLALNDWIEVGVYTKKGKTDSLIYLKKVLITDKNSSLTIEVDQEPVKAGIDPLFKLVDRNWQDNIKATKNNKI